MQVAAQRQAQREYMAGFGTRTRTHAHEIAQATENSSNRGLLFYNDPERSGCWRGFGREEADLMTSDDLLGIKERPRISRAYENFSARLKITRASE